MLRCMYPFLCLQDTMQMFILGPTAIVRKAANSCMFQNLLSHFIDRMEVCRGLDGWNSP